jgi:hypothetical protein
MSDDSVEYVSSSRVIRIVESNGEKILRYAKSNGAVGTLKIKQFQMCKTGTWYE